MKGECINFYEARGAAVDNVPQENGRARNGNWETSCFLCFIWNKNIRNLGYNTADLFFYLIKI
jgi:hypothetical protein